MALQFRILFGGREHPPPGPLAKIEDAFPKNRAAKKFMGCLVNVFVSRFSAIL